MIAKTFKYYDIHDNELLHLEVQLKLMLKILCCRFSPMYVYTDNTLNHIQAKAINGFNDKMKNTLKSEQIKAFYGGEEIGYDYDISMFKIYNYSTITTYIDYDCTEKCCQNYNRKWLNLM